ncbi:hypothetical protein OQJ13_10085 [Legionella sp. PATHC035]|uniref:hypothetical protein n=1 Tax=Legionella sp. PATHC035 TaxID=2992040 RepID=UPI002243E788|nr:hypothetical protein [Legionella sp. PATHC035]MCW8409321.1 hypothetical protein [Legionella sp. PATHC035]
MEEKVETTISKHSQLISLMKVLGYPSDEDGICNGYAYMGMQAFFAKELDVFKQRVDHLLNIPLNDFENEAAIQFDALKNDLLNQGTNEDDYSNRKDSEKSF